jgi:hypothetical protein
MYRTQWVSTTEWLSEFRGKLVAPVVLDTTRKMISWLPLFLLKGLLWYFCTEKWSSLLKRNGCRIFLSFSTDFLQLCLMIVIWKVREFCTPLLCSWSQVLTLNQEKEKKKFCLCSKRHEIKKLTRLSKDFVSETLTSQKGCFTRNRFHHKL